MGVFASLQNVNLFKKAKTQVQLTRLIGEMKKLGGI